MVSFLLLLSTSTAVAATFEILDGPPVSAPMDCELAETDEVTVANAGGRYAVWDASGDRLEISGGDPASHAVGVSLDGDTICGTVVGAAGRRRPARWTADTGWQPLDPSGAVAGTAHGIDGLGLVVVGLAWLDARPVAFRWSADTGFDPLPDSGRGSRATAVDAAADVVVGFDEHPTSGQRRPACWRGSELELLAGPEGVGEAVAVDQSGRFCCGQVDGRAFLHDDGQGLQDLGCLGDGPGERSLATAVSGQGVVVGWSGDPVWGVVAPFVWTADAGMHPLAAWLDHIEVSVPMPLQLVDVLDISQDGSQMVGSWQDDTWRRGFWRLTGITPGDYAMLPPVAADEPGWRRDFRRDDLQGPPRAPGRPLDRRRPSSYGTGPA